MAIRSFEEVVAAGLGLVVAVHSFEVPVAKAGLVGLISQNSRLGVSRIAMAHTIQAVLEATASLSTAEATNQVSRMFTVLA